MNCRVGNHDRRERFRGEVGKSPAAREVSRSDFFVITRFGTELGGSSDPVFGTPECFSLPGSRL
jgi:hypothetical protein